MPSWFSQVGGGRRGAAAAFACCVALAVLGVWLLARMAWPPASRDEGALENPVHTDDVAAGAAAPARSVADWHLFGAVVPKLGAGGIAVSVSSLILRGTIAQADPKTGVAVIADAGNGERAFGVGDEVISGVRLDAVYPDHVVLLRNGVGETLNLTRDMNLAPEDIVRPTPATASSRTVTATSASAPVNPASSVQSANAPSQWQQQIAQLRQNPGELMKRVQVIPVLDGVNLSGVRLSVSGADAALLGQIGLRADDVVVAVNGMSIDSIAHGQQIVSNLGSASAARVTVLRDGKPVDLNVTLQ
jgi:general secretion pathway protein C